MFDKLGCSFQGLKKSFSTCPICMSSTVCSLLTVLSSLVMALLTLRAEGRRKGCPLLKVVTLVRGALNLAPANYE
jgi:hypothetical protein